MRRIDPAPADGERPAGPGGAETLDQPGRADDVRDRVVSPDFVEAHVVDSHAVYRRLRRGEPREHVEGPGPHRGVEIGRAEQGADVAVAMVLVGGFVAAVVTMSLAIVRVGLAIPPARLVYREPRSGQCMIGVIDALDGGDRVEPGTPEGRHERPLELGPGVEHRRREHVARNSADGIKLDMHD